SYFDEKFLVRQQLNSFDEFIQMSLQRIMEDAPPIDLQVEAQHASGEVEELVLIAQEKMATNTVYVFAKKDSKFAYTGECRSCLENSYPPTSTIWVSMLARGGQGAKKSTICQHIVASLPYIKQEIPINIVFRDLGFVSDRGILEHIIYDFEDPEMMEMGHAVGLVENLALIAYISGDSTPSSILEFLEEWSTESLEEISPAAIAECV
ncbi:DNA-directed RNA polymerase II subunit RPB2, partial [Sciurus carolinensis]|nr:DNA-directed RNA polymerase II subunit RPB2 [Sciurus carolinensis]